LPTPAQDGLMMKYPARRPFDRDQAGGSGPRLLFRTGSGRFLSALDRGCPARDQRRSLACPPRYRIFRGIFRDGMQISTWPAPPNPRQFIESIQDEYQHQTGDRL